MNDLSELIKECEPLAEIKHVNYELLAMSRRLADLGFDYLAAEMRDRVLINEKLESIKNEKYPVVTPEKIKKFLSKRAASYNEQVMKTYSQNANRATASIRDQMIGNMFGPDMDNVLTRTFNQVWNAGSPGSVSQVFTFDAEAGTVQETKSYVRFTAMTGDFLSPSKDRITAFAWEEVPVKDYKAIPPDHALEALRVAREKEIFHDFTIASVTHVKDPLLLGVLNGKEDRYYLAAWGDDIALDDVI